MSHDDMDTKESILHRMPKRPGNFGGETFREWCGLSKRRASVDRAVTAQDVYRACGKRGA